MDNSRIKGRREPRERKKLSSCYLIIDKELITVLVIEGEVRIQCQPCVCNHIMASLVPIISNILPHSQRRLRVTLTPQVVINESKRIWLNTCLRW